MARHIFSLNPMFSLNHLFLRNRVLAFSPAPAALAVLSLLALLLVVPVTRAQASAFTPEAHCADVASLVSRAGGAILETAPETFHRVVKDNSFCDPDGVARPAYAPTQDNPACFVGYKCSDYPVR
jgi:hypothetical protein